MSTARAAGIVSVIALISKLTGFIREMVIAHGYGASVATDAYRVAQSVPTLFLASIGAALSTVLIPLFSQNAAEGGIHKAYTFVRRLTTITLLVTIVILICGIFAAPWIVKILAPGFHGYAYELSVKITRILVPSLLFAVLASIANGVLQSMGQFAIPALMSLPMNFLVIIAVLALSDRAGIWALSGATLIGIALQFLVQWPALRRCGFRFHFDLNLRDSYIRKAGVLIMPVIIGTALMQINTLLNRMFASNLSVGSISVLDYCNKLTGLVVGIVINTVATVTLPKFSQIADSGVDKLSQKVGVALSSLNMITIPMSVGLVVLRTPIIRFVYERGAFTPEATQLTASALLFAGMSLVGWGMREVAARAFYALKNTITPMVNSIIAVVLNIILLFFFVGRLKLGVPGMALATTCSITVAGFLLTFFLYRKIGGSASRKIFNTALRCFISAMVMAAIVTLVYSFVERIIPGNGFISQSLELLITIGVGAVTYILGLLALSVNEVQYGLMLVRKMIGKIFTNKV